MARKNNQSIKRKWKKNQDPERKRWLEKGMRSADEILADYKVSDGEYEATKPTTLALIQNKALPAAVKNWLLLSVDVPHIRTYRANQKFCSWVRKAVSEIMSVAEDIEEYDAYEVLGIDRKEYQGAKAYLTTHRARNLYTAPLSIGSWLHAYFDKRSARYMLSSVLASFRRGFINQAKQNNETYSLLTVTQKNDFFYGIYEIGLSDKFEILSARDDSLVPANMFEEYTTWKEGYEEALIFEERELDRKLQTILTDLNKRPEPLVIYDIPEVQVESLVDISQPNIVLTVENDACLVEGGVFDRGLSADAENEFPQRDRQNLRRTDTLRNILNEAGISATIYLDKSGRYKYPYNVAVIDQEDIQAQILVCDYYGFVTMVNKAPEPYNPDVQIKLTSFKDSQFVWTSRYKTREQWSQKLLSLLNSDVTHLEPELKHRTFWTNQEQPALQTFVAHILVTGKKPKTSDKTPFLYGPLAGRTTPARMYGALKRQSIARLELTRSFNALYNDLRVRIPELDSFLNKKPITMAVLYNESSGFTQREGLPPQAAFTDIVELCGHSESELNLAFQYHAIHGWDEFWARDEVIEANNIPNYPHSLDDFVLKTGLAKVGADGVLVPAKN